MRPMTSIHPAMTMLGRVVSSVARTLGHDVVSVDVTAETITLRSRLGQRISPMLAEQFADALVANLRRIGFDRQEREVTAQKDGWRIRITIHVEN